MKNTNVYNGKLQVIERMKNSLNGNPRYMIMVGTTVMDTGVDSSLGYSVTNYANKEVIATAGMYRGKLTVSLINKK